MEPVAVTKGLFHSQQRKHGRVASPPPGALLPQSVKMPVLIDLGQCQAHSRAAGSWAGVEGAIGQMPPPAHVQGQAAPPRLHPGHLPAAWQTHPGSRCAGCNRPRWPGTSCPGRSGTARPWGWSARCTQRPRCRSCGDTRRGVHEGYGGLESPLRAESQNEEPQAPLWTAPPGEREGSPRRECLLGRGPVIGSCPSSKLPLP